MPPVLRIKTPDIAKILKGSKAALSQVIDGNLQPLLAVVEIIRTIILERMRFPGEGRTYRRRGITHQASAPGASPATDRGNLISAIATAITGKNRVGLGIRGNAPYWADLEFGTVKMAPRPFIRPAVRIAKRGMADQFTKKLRARAKRLLARRRKSRGRR